MKINGIVLTPCVSSNLLAYGWNKKKQVLIVAFRDGSVYQYNEVPESKWLLFKTAPSKGKYLWKEIRDQFEYERIK